MKWEFYIYWLLYSVVFAIECLITKMPLWASYCILTSYWLSYIFLGFVFGVYKYLDLEYKNVYIEGLLAAFISRSILQIISIFGYQEKRFVIAVTGFSILMWVAIIANRTIKHKIKDIERTLL